MKNKGGVRVTKEQEMDMQLAEFQLARLKSIIDNSEKPDTIQSPLQKLYDGLKKDLEEVKLMWNN